MADYLFKTVVWQKDLQGLAGAGLIGLSPSNNGHGAQLFVPSLYEQGAIKKNMFSMFIDPNGHSKIQIGGYDLNKYAKGPLHWYKITRKSFWQLNMHNVKLGDESFKPSVHTVMADTGTSLNMIPDTDYYKIYDKFFKGKFKCRKLPNTLHSCDCTKSQQESIPDISFDIGEETYTIPRDKWFERSGNQCVIKFMHGPRKGYWILGLNFFENYYTVFDYETMSIGFAESIRKGVPTTKSFINWATGKDTKVKKHVIPALMNLAMQVPMPIESIEFKLFAIFGASLVFIFSAYYCIMKKYKNATKVRA
jgi:hypothetical protein